MNKWIFLPLLFFLGSCNEKTTDTFFTTQKASEYFKSIEEICNADNGNLWGENLYGPIMFVERTSRRIVANMPDNEGLLKEKDGVYIGFYPKELILSNAPVKFGGLLFAMTPLPAEEDIYKIKTHAIHGLFHRFQETEGISTVTFNVTNMDDKEARLLIKLELNALKKAINSTDEDRQLAIRDALIFRGSKMELYSKSALVENRFVTYEGLATFTYTLLCAKTPEEVKTRLTENLDRVYTMQSFSRSYGSIDGAIYASLLYDKGFDFRKLESFDTDLGNAVKELYKIDLPVICRDVAGSLAINYDIDIVNKEEDTRLTDIKTNIHKLVSTFTEKPVVYFELRSPYFDFEPENVLPLDTVGTLYSSMRVSDSWGKLTVDNGGCLISNNFKYLRVTAKGYTANNNQISGEGWHLILNKDWELVPVNENYIIRRLMP